MIFRKFDFEKPRSLKVISDIETRFQQICDAMNDLVPSQYFSSSSQVSSHVSRKLKYGMTRLSESLDNFALHDTNTRNCIDFIQNGDLNKVNLLLFYFIKI